MGRLQNQTGSWTRDQKAIKEVLPGRLEELRKHYRLTMSEVGGWVGVTESSIYGWESGISLPPADKLARLCMFFFVSADWLVGMSEVSCLPYPPFGLSGTEYTTNLAQLKELRGVTWPEMCAAADIGKRALKSARESDSRVYLPTLTCVARALGCSLDYLLGFRHTVNMWAMEPAIVCRGKHG